MRITLSEFRCVSGTRSYDFKPRSITQLYGPSGIGKTTVFEAIFWCFYGGRRSVAPKDSLKAHTSVILEFEAFEFRGQQLRITRSKPPEVFEVIEDQNRYVGLEAERWVQYYCGSKELFNVSSYLIQGARSPLMDLSAADRFALLQELSFGENLIQTPRSPAWTLHQIETHTKLQKQQEARLQAQLAILTPVNLSELSRLENSLRHLVNQLNIVDPSLTSTLLANQQQQIRLDTQLSHQLQSQILQTSTQITRLQTLKLENTQNRSRLKELDQQLQHLPTESELLRRLDQLEAFNLRCSLQKEVDKLELEVSEYLLDSESLRQALQWMVSVRSNLPKGPESIAKWWSQVSLERQSLTDSLQQDYVKQAELKQRQHQHLEYARQLTNYQTLSAELEKQQSTYEALCASKLTKPVDSLTKLQQELQAASALSCPNCQASLRLRDSRLELLEHSHPRSVAEIQRDIDQHRKFETQESQLQRLEHQIEILKLQRGESPIAPDFEQVSLLQLDVKEQRLRLLKSFITPPECLLLLTLDETHSLSAHQITQLERWSATSSQLAKLPSVSKSIDSKLELTQQLKQLTQLIAQKAAIVLVNHDFDSLPRLVAELANLQSQHQRITQSTAQRLQLIEDLQKYLHQLHSHQTILELNQQYLQCTQRLSALSTLKESTISVMNRVFEKYVALINSHLLRLSSIMFHDELILQLALRKELKTREVTKSQVHLRILRVHQKQTLDDDEIQSLSGGEKSRANLCCTLAISQLRSNPLLLIDEGMASLDEKLREECLSVIRDQGALKTAVNICHGLAPGHHDHVMSV